MLVPESGAALALAGNALLTRSQCSEAVRARPSSTIPVEQLAAGTHVCVRTSEGRVAEFRVAAPVGPSPGTLTIQYTTWEN